MRKHLGAHTILFLIAVTTASVQAYVPVDHDDKWFIPLNGRWRFALDGPSETFHRPGFDDSGWALIQVPSNWEVEGFEEPRYGKPDEGTGLYRRRFSVPSAWKNRRTIIRFEGVLYGFQFWVNSRQTGLFNSAFNRSEFDITELVRLGKSNTIAVRVDRRSRGWDFDTHDAWGLSGIYRDVIIFSVPATHVQDYAVTSKIQSDWSAATLLCDFTIASASSDSRETVRLNAELIGPSGGVAETKEEEIRLAKGSKTMRLSFHIDKPKLWNAESPRLYELNVRLVTADGLSHTFKRKVGLREVSIDGDVLKLNHRPLKIRGVNHHDIHPDVGRAMRLEHYREDVELMKKANINAVRTSHYPPHPMFLSLCDEYGLYVIDEVPFGKGEDHLEDESYLPDLLMRAEATVSRDKNHSSVIIWSIGNENSVTSNVVRTVEKVKRLDPTRPTLLPGAGSGGSYKTKLPDCVDIMAPHYPYTYPAPERGRWGLSEAAVAPDIKRPILCTEYNHSLGTAFEGLKDHWEMMEKYDRLAGGCIWHFQNQGLKRKINGREVANDTKTRLTIGKDALSADTWINDRTILDSRGGSGTDGIVYADRFPQVDYWITRKVYSPVVVPIKEIRIRPGKQRIEIPIRNRYDFTNLNQIRGHWKLMRDGKTIQSGNLVLSAPPHQKTSTVVDLQVGRDLNRHEHLLELKFIDFENRSIDEHSIHLLPQGEKVDFAQRLTDMPSGLLQREDSTNITRYTVKDYRFDVNKTAGTVTISSSRSGKTLLEGPFLRVGRTPAMAEYRNYPRYNIKFWEPPLLTDAKLLDCRISAPNKDTAIVRLKLEYVRANPGSPAQSVIADLHWTVSSQGWIDVDYELSPRNVDGCFLELGLAFQLPQETNELHWLGDGPFNSYPGQSDAARRGIWYVKPKPMTDPYSRYYDGNRTNVDIAAITDRAGNGLGLMMDKATISLENNADGMVFSHLLHVAGKGNKTGGMMTLLPVNADEITSAQGSLRIMVLESDNWPDLLQTLFAD